MRPDSFEDNDKDQDKIKDNCLHKCIILWSMTCVPYAAYMQHSLIHESFNPLWKHQLIFKMVNYILKWYSGFGRQHNVCQKYPLFLCFSGTGNCFTFSFVDCCETSWVPSINLFIGICIWGEGESKCAGSQIHKSNIQKKYVESNSLQILGLVSPSSRKADGESWRSTRSPGIQEPSGNWIQMWKRGKTTHSGKQENTSLSESLDFIFGTPNIGHNPQKVYFPEQNICFCWNSKRSFNFLRAKSFLWKQGVQKCKRKRSPQENFNIIEWLHSCWRIAPFEDT